MKTILITGSTSGIGKASALLFAEKGYKVIATARNPQKVDLSKINKNIYMYQMDVSDVNSIETAFEQILKDHKQIDVLLNNAGYGMLAPFELVPKQEIEKIFATNVFGVLEVSRLMIKQFKKQNSGTIISVTSIGGLVAMPLNTIYHATKYAVEGFMQSLLYEMQNFNVKVKLVEPGGVKTNFANSAVIIQDEKNYPEYQRYINQIVKGFSSFTSDEDGENRYSTSEQVAEVIYQAANDDSDKLHYLAGKDAIGFYNSKKQLSAEEFVDLMKKRFR